MRILQVITDTDRRGAQIFAADLHAELARLGNDVTSVALAPGTAGAPLDVPTIGPRRLAPATLWKLRRAIRRADVVAAHGSSTLPACALAGLGTGVPFVYRQISEILFWARSRSRGLRVRAMLSRARLVVTLSETMGGVLSRHFGVPAWKLRVIPNGVPARSFRVSNADEKRRARARFGLNPWRSVVLFLGALVPEKGADVAVEAMSAIPDVQLLVVGDGPERAALERLAAQHANGRVRFTGPVNEPQAAMGAADVVVLPSRAGDAMPATLIEAALCGLPAISTPVGAIPEIVVNGETGLLVQRGDPTALGDAVRTVLANPETAADMGRRARTRCLDRYEITVVAQAWQRALADAANARPA